MSLQLIQQELKAPKNQENKFGGFQYRSCEDILEAVKPLLEQHNCTLTISDELVLIGDRYYVKATATISGAVFTDGCAAVGVTAYAREPESKKGMDASQITGACSSYARKYALNGLFLIDDTKDADGMDNRKTDDQNTIKPKLLSTMKSAWKNAVAAYVRDSNFDQIEKRMTISPENKELIKKDANEMG